MKNFAMIGVAGYVAPRHLRAIKDSGNQLVAALDKSDSVGILDSFFPDADFFTEFERFDRHVEKLRRTEKDRAVDYVSIASPNYLHDAHIRFALRIGANAICEKPLVLNPWNLDALEKAENEFGRKIFSVLQLRYHPEIGKLKKRINENIARDKHVVNLTYITSRGRWYQYSWKGDEAKSGGIATNIGIHFFDILGWIFGGVEQNIVHFRQADRASGYLELAKARIRWFLSLNGRDLPQEVSALGNRTYRCIEINGEPFDFTEGIQDLHTRVYEEALIGRGCGLDDNRKAIDITYAIRHATIEPNRGEHHPLCRSLYKK